MQQLRRCGWACSTPSRSQIGQAVTLTATISAAQAPPRGYLTFLRNRTQRLGTVALDAQGRASLTVRDLPLGDHSITVEYAGDDNFDVTLSAVLTQTVVPATLHLPLVARGIGERVGSRRAAKS